MKKICLLSILLIATAIEIEHTNPLDSSIESSSSETETAIIPPVNIITTTELYCHFLEQVLPSNTPADIRQLFEHWAWHVIPYLKYISDSKNPPITAGNIGVVHISAKQYKSYTHIMQAMDHSQKQALEQIRHALRVFRSINWDAFQQECLRHNFTYTSYPEHHVIWLVFNSQHMQTYMHNIALQDPSISDEELSSYFPYTRQRIARSLLPL